MTEVQKTNTSDTSPPTYTDASLEQAQTALYATNNPQDSAPERPPSPAPSYHTIAPSTHTTLDSAALTRAALETPDAILSKLNITNNARNQNSKSGEGSRFISARTDPDSKERYYISFHPSRDSQGIGTGGQEMQIFKADNSDRHTPLATTKISSTRATVCYDDGEILQADFAELQETGKFPLKLRVEGLKREFYWEVVVSRRNSEDSSEGDQSQKRSSKPIFGIQSQRKKDIMKRIIGMRLVDSVNGDIWAGYVHAPQKNAGDTKHISKSGKWGFVEVKARAVRLDDGVDRAFVALISLLESYIRLWGQEAAAAEKWEGLAGAVLLCMVM